MTYFERFSERIKKSETLNELFQIWSEAHCSEPHQSCLMTFPRRNTYSLPSPDTVEKFKSSFCRDGHLGCGKSADIMIVLKECNLKNDAAVGTPYSIDNDFWFKDYLIKRNITNNTYYKCISVIVNELVNKNSFDRSAIMEINKRGGYSSANETALFNYAFLYKEFLQKQIDIIAPKYIVCLGTFDLVSSVLFENADVPEKKVLIHTKKGDKHIKYKTLEVKTNGKDTVVVSMYHPAAYGCNNKEYYRKIFRAILDDCGLL